MTDTFNPLSSTLHYMVQSKLPVTCTLWLQTESHEEVGCVQWAVLQGPSHDSKGAMAACSDSETIPLVLVTGASGYLANHIVQQLLEEKSYRLRGTVRNVSSTLSLREQFPSLHIVEADLNDDKGWQEYVIRTVI